MTTLSSHILAAALGAAAVLGAQYLALSPESEDGKPAQEIVGEQRKLLACTPSTVYDSGVKKKLGLPPAVVADPKREVASAIQVHRAMHPHTVSALKNLETGDTDLFVRHDDTAWLAFEHPKYASLQYGYDNLGAVTRVSVGVSILQIKNVDLSSYVVFDDRGDKEVGVEARAEF